MNITRPDEPSSTLPTGRGSYQITLSNNQTRQFVVNNHPTGQSTNTKEFDELIIIIVLHPSTRLFQNYSPYGAANEYQAIIGQEISDAAASTFDLTRKKLIELYPVSREVEEGYFCWGAGSDNDLCTAPVDGADPDFIMEIINWIHHKVGGNFWPPSSSMSRVFLFGYSGGARMGWRLACDPRFENILDGVALASGLLPENLKAQVRNGLDTCAISSLPSRIIVLHGELDTLTGIEYADESVRWISKFADCQAIVESKLGSDDIFNHTECINNERLALAYYRKVDGAHQSPDVVQMQTIFKHWSQNHILTNISNDEDLDNSNPKEDITKSPTVQPKRLYYINEVALGYIISICVIALVVNVRRYR